MKLQLIDINEFIKKNNLKQVTTAKLYEKPGKIDSSGLFSEEIFGRLGSMERRKTFAYVELNCKVIHPEVYPLLCGLDTTISKLLNYKKKYSLTDKGTLIEDPEKGDNGILFFISIFDNLNLNAFKKPEIVNFIKKNRKTIFIDKWLILPAGIRDISISRTSGQVLITFSDLSELYTALVRVVSSISPELPREILDPLAERVQKLLIEINTWIKNRMKGKQGIIRGGLLKKAVDFSARLVAITDHTLPLGTVGLPWQVVLKLYEPFAINYILKKDTNAVSIIQNFLNSSTSIDSDSLKKLFDNLVQNPDIIPETLKEYFITVAKDIAKNKLVIYKRDPVENRDSWLSAYIRVENDGYGIKLNPLDLPRTGGDHDGDTYACVALFTKEAQEEAKQKMLPTNSSSMWTSVTSSSSCPYQITLDAMTAIYSATK